MKAALAVLLVAASVLAALPAPAAAQGSQSVQSSSPPWWPPNGPQSPADYADGWNLRVPVRVEGREGSMPAGSPVMAHLDLGQAAIAAGWPSGASLSGAIPRGFTLDPDSIRLVEYGGPDWKGGPIAEVPARVHLGWLEPDQSRTLGKTQLAPFDAQRNPLVTLQWLLPHSLGPRGDSEGVQDYYVYYDVLENSDRPAAAPLPDDVGSRLDALYWGGSGTVLYGHHSGASSSATRALAVSAAEDGTIVEVLTSSGGTQFRRHQPSGGFANPFQLDAGQVLRYPVGTTPQHIKVVATGPVSAVTIGGVNSGEGEFMPSLDGTFRGTRFVFPVNAPHFSVLAPDDGKGRFVSACFVQRDAGGATVRGPECLSGLLPGEYKTFAIWGVDAPSRVAPIDHSIDIMATDDSGPFLLQSTPQGRTGLAQVPSAWGGPVGEDFATALSTRQGHELTATAVGEPAHLRVLQPPQPAGQGNPPGSTAVTNVPLRSAGATFTIPGNQFPIAPEAIEGNDETNPLLVQALRPDRVPAPIGLVPDDELGDLLVVHGIVGSSLVQTTPVGGLHARQFTVRGPFALDAFYNGTTVTVAPVGGTSKVVGLGTQAPREVAGTAETRTVVTADKPIAVLPLPLAPTSAAPVRALAARPDFIVGKQGLGEYRGFLVDVRPVPDLDPVFVNARPGATVDVPLLVRNLARWNGAPTLDHIDLSAKATPADWGGVVGFAPSGLDLPNADPAAATMTIQLPQSLPDAGVVLRVQAASAGNPNMKGSFSVVVSARQTFEVDAYFGEADDGAGPESLPARLAPEEEESFPFVVANLGSGEDRFSLALPSLDGGWSAQVLRQGLPVTTTPVIPPGESEAFVLRVKAPASETLPSLTIPLDVRSLGSKAAADRLLLNARLFLGEDLELRATPTTQAVAPGGTVRFVVEAANLGRDALSVLFDMPAALPAGWSASFDGAGNPSAGPIALGPGATIDIPITMRAPATASADDLASQLLRAEAVGDGAKARDAIALTGVAAALHDLRVAVAKPAAVRPGEPARIRVSVENHGNGIEPVDVEPVSMPGGWTLQAPSGLVLEAGQNATFDLNLTVPAGTPSQETRVGLAVVAGESSRFPFEAKVLIDRVDGLALGPAATARMSPGQNGTQALVLRNGGNLPRLLALSVSVPQGWTASVQPDVADLPAGASTEVQVRWHVAAAAIPGTALVRVTASDGAGTLGSDIEVRVGAAAAELVGVVVPGAAPAPGAFALVSATVRNPGDTPLRGLAVRLLSGDAVLDRVGFESIGPNRSVLAPLLWANDERGVPDAIDWGLEDADGFHRIGSAPFTAPSAAGAGPERLPAPGLALAVLAVALAMLARRLRP